MKLLLTVLALFIIHLSHAQLEFQGDFEKTPFVILIDEDEPVFIFYEAIEESIVLYNMDMTLLVSMTIPIEYDGPANALFHVSRQLFDCDSTNIEYLITRAGFEPEERFVKIFREDGEEIFSLPEHYYETQEGIIQNPSIGYPLAQVEDGVQFVFRNGFGGTQVTSPSKVYKSCGQIPSYSCQILGSGGNVGLDDNVGGVNAYSLHPNPGDNRFEIEYQLPNGQSEGQLLVYSISGQLVLEKRVGEAMRKILVNTSDWETGRYEVVLRTKEGGFISQSYIEM